MDSTREESPSNCRFIEGDPVQCFGRNAIIEEIFHSGYKVRFEDALMPLAVRFDEVHARDWSNPSSLNGLKR